jgi:hypothetical protein
MVKAGPTQTEVAGAAYRGSIDDLQAGIRASSARAKGRDAANP